MSAAVAVVLAMILGYLYLLSKQRRLQGKPPLPLIGVFMEPLLDAEDLSNPTLSDAALHSHAEQPPRDGHEGADASGKTTAIFRTTRTTTSESPISSSTGTPTSETTVSMTTSSPRPPVQLQFEAMTPVIVNSSVVESKPPPVLSFQSMTPFSLTPAPPPDKPPSIHQSNHEEEKSKPDKKKKKRKKKHKKSKDSSEENEEHKKWSKHKHYVKKKPEPTSSEKSTNDKLPPI